MLDGYHSNRHYCLWAIYNLCVSFLSTASSDLTPAPEGGVTVISIGGSGDGGPCLAISSRVRGPVRSPGLDLGSNASAVWPWVGHTTSLRPVAVICSMANVESAQDYKIK